MGFDRERFDETKAAFTIDDDTLRRIADDFRANMCAGLSGEKGATLRMLRSYAGLPSGKEHGSFLALDFGGTNVRALRILLKGGGEYEVLSKVAKPLTLPGVYDYVSADATAEEMFDFLAEIIDEAIEGNRTTKYLLGHTFSFPSQQTDLYNAKLIVWTKEFATQGVEGKVVNDLLKEALARRGMRNVEPVAVINDTVAVLLAAAYKHEHTYIGSIYATGQNTCYYEEFADGSEPPTVINMESGGFGKLPFSKYDEILDRESEQPGAQRLEKMVSGRYLGSLYGAALADLLGTDGVYPFSSIELSEIIADAYLDRHSAGAVIEAKTGMTFTASERALLRSSRLQSSSALHASLRRPTSPSFSTAWVKTRLRTSSSPSTAPSMRKSRLSRIICVVHSTRCSWTRRSTSRSSSKTPAPPSAQHSQQL